MAVLFADGFDWLSTATDITQRWDSGLVNLVTTPNTAFSVGAAVSVGLNNPLVKTLPSNESTIYISIRRKQTAGTTSTTFQSLLLTETAGVQVAIRFAEDGSIGVYTASAGTLLGSAAPSGTAVSGTWDSWQIKVVINATTGSVEIRKNGSTTPTLTVSGVNTRNGTSNAYANKFSILGSSGANTVQYDDVFIYSGSGAAPNNWLGDLRAITDAPTTMVQNQFLKSPASTVWGQTSTASNAGTGVAANTIGWFKVTVPFTGTVSQVTVSLATSITGSLNAALYSDSSGVPGALLSQSTGVSNPAAGSSTFVFGATQSIVKGTAYWVALWSSANLTSGVLNGTTSATVPRLSQALTYTGTFPSTGASATNSLTTFGPYTALDLTGIAAVSLVNDTTQDGDTSYLYSSTPGDEDLYGFPSLAAQGVTPVSIVGVQPFAIMKRSDSGSRTVSVRAKSAGVDVAVASSSAVSLTYQNIAGFLALDPATGAAWTTSAVDALAVGVKIDG